MYRVPKDLDLSKVIGEFTTQIRVGKYDIQFTFGEVNFAVQSELKLVLNGDTAGIWTDEKWPDAIFREIINVDVVRYDIPNDRTIVLHLDNKLELHLCDNSDQYECLRISIEGSNSEWII